MGAEGLFRTGLVALVVAVLVCAFVPLRRTAFLRVAGAASAAVLLGFLALGAGLSGGLCAALLVLSQAIAAAGLAALGRRIGAGAVASGAVSAGLLAVALQGLFWADAAAQHVPTASRWIFKQAVLDLDAATALAYDGASFDRLGHAPIYAGVPLASSAHARPTAVRAALVWGVLGVLAAGVAGVGRRALRVPARP